MLMFYAMYWQNVEPLKLGLIAVESWGLLRFIIKITTTYEYLG